MPSSARKKKRLVLRVLGVLRRLCVLAALGTLAVLGRLGVLVRLRRPPLSALFPYTTLFRSLLLLLVAPCLNCLEAVKKPPPVAFKVMCLLPITILYAWVLLVLNLPFKALMFLTLMRPSLVLFLVL